MEKKIDSLNLSLSYFLKLAAVILIPSILGLVVAKYIYPNLNIMLLSTIPLVMLVMGIWFFFLLKAIEKNPSKANIISSVNMVLKLLLSLTTIGLVAFKFNEYLLIYVAAYFVVYAILLVFETKYIIRVSKTKKRIKN